MQKQSVKQETGQLVKQGAGKQVALVLLAAGDSRRYGGNKLLAEVEGIPMYRHIVGQVLALPEDFFCTKVIVSQYPEILADVEGGGFTAVENRESSLGISHSIHLGLHAVEKSGTDADAVCFAVCDQPWLKKETVSGLVSGWQDSGKGLATLCCGEQEGNPTVFSRAYFPALMDITGDRGGRKVLRSNPEDVYRHEITDARELEDVDERRTFGNLQ